jgi:hypothetical protein
VVGARVEIHADERSLAGRERGQTIDERLKIHGFSLASP